ncbi:MAG: metal-dependent hydrolase [Candidatus Doudnabacteria bacterium]|nr:metal-dependent hydrolase [Candidatus Doudnabacteria bacterium]
MLPIGHIAAGFLVGVGFTKLFLPEAPLETLGHFGIWGAFWGFAPDLDELWFFYKNKSLLVAPGKVDKYHRNFVTHAPLLWLILGILASTLSKSQFWRQMGYVVWLSSWTHFLLDSIEYGIPWLWPYSQKLYALKGAGIKPFVIEEKNFFKHSLQFLLYYTQTLSFYLEIIIIIIAVFVYIR